MTCRARRREQGIRAGAPLWADALPSLRAERSALDFALIPIQVVQSIRREMSLDNGTGQHNCYSVSRSMPYNCTYYNIAIACVI